MPTKIKGKWKFNKGERINSFTVVDPERDEDKIECKCDCGNVKRILARKLANKPPINCGDHSKHEVNKRKVNINIGDRFGLLEVLYEDLDKSTYNIKHYVCKCSCGTIRSYKGSYLNSKKVSSCGCLKIKKQKKALGFHKGTNLITLKQTKAMKTNFSTKERNVYYVKSRKEYLVRFQVCGKTVYNKYFKTLEEAVKMRNIFRDNDLKEMIAKLEEN